MSVTSVSNAAARADVNRVDGADIVLVPEGEFIMGESADTVAALIEQEPRLEAEWFAPEQPQRSVFLGPYWIYRSPVTVAQYRAFCDAAKHPMPPTPSHGWVPGHPVVEVTWEDAMAYAQWAGARLPTEAQWEKAARGTDGRRFPWGNSWDAALCVSSAGADIPDSPARCGSIAGGASPYGCLDMAGNVWEWCADRYSRSYYADAPDRDPLGPDAGDQRVIRGGSWQNYVPTDFRCACRLGYLPNRRNCFSVFGFRCAIPASG